MSQPNGIWRVIEKLNISNFDVDVIPRFVYVLNCFLLLNCFKCV